MSIGTKLQEARKKKGFSLKTLSSKIGKSTSFLSDIEHDRSKPSIETLKSLCDVLNLSLDSLFDETPSKNQNLILDLSEVLPYLEDFSTWNDYDKQELICYLKAKNLVRNQN